MSVTDAVAFVSRKAAAGGFRSLAVALFRYFPSKAGTATISDFDGDLSIQLDRSSYISSAIYWSGRHSPEVQSFVCDFLRPEMVFVDVGANIGEITLVAAKRLTQGQVLAFEPSPNVFKRLSKNVQLNGFPNVRLHNFGLSDKPGTLPLYLRRDDVYGTLNDGVSSLFPREKAREQGSVLLRTLDDLSGEYRLARLDLMKIDVEGAELMVLRGAQGAIQRFRPVIVMEIDEVNFQTAGYTTTDLLSALQAVGYGVPPRETTKSDVPTRCDAAFFPRETGNSMQILTAGE